MYNFFVIFVNFKDVSLLSRLGELCLMKMSMGSGGQGDPYIMMKAWR